MNKDILNYGRRTIEFTQSLADFGVMRGEDGQLLRLDGSKIKHHHAFKDWQHSLKMGERLPRGRYFKGKKPGKPVVMFDEIHNLFDHTAFRE